MGNATNYKYEYLVAIASNKFSDELVCLITDIRKQSDLRVIIALNGLHSAAEATKLNERIKNLGNVELITIQEKGKSNALNVILSHYTSKNLFVIFTDDDVKIGKHWIKNFVDGVEENGRGYYYGSSVDVRYEVPPQDDLKRYLPGSALGYNDKSLRDMKIFSGCNWGAFAEDIEIIGGFDTRFGPGSRTQATGQESNMMKRLIKNGMKPKPIEDNTVIHYVPAKNIGFPWVLNRQMRSGIETGLEYDFNVAYEVFRYCITLALSFLGIKKFKIASRYSLGKLKGYYYRNWQSNSGT